MLGLYGRPLIKQPIEAWRYGPVIRDLYQSLKIYGDQYIQEPIPNCGKEELDNQEKDIIQQIFSKFGNMSGIALSALTHLDGSPWETTWSLNKRNAIIPNDLIRIYHENLVNESATR